MKINKLFIGLSILAGMGGMSSCSDFDEVNTDPSKAGIEYVKPQYALNKSISAAQMDPGTAERVVVYNWASAARICGEMTSYLAGGRYSDDFMATYYYPGITGWIKNATLAMQVADEAIPKDEHEKAFYANVKQFARVWRAYLISEFADNFGPYALDGFKGINPVFDSEKDVYYFILQDLTEAVAAINTSVEPKSEEAECDPALSYNAAKWIKYANSLRMRLAMRLSEVDPDKAKTEFEAAVKEDKILTLDDMFAVKEDPGWNDFSGVYTRSFDDQTLSATMANILTNLGGVSVTSQRADLASYVKEKNYLGLRFVDHFVPNTDNPTKQFWLDGLPENLDPRALKIFCLPDDEAAKNYIDKSSTTTAKSFNLLLDSKGEKKLNIDATCCWNGFPDGTRTAWSPINSMNELFSKDYGTVSTLPILGDDYCSGNNKRIFFAPWETYFLMAEAALYGWNAGMSAEAAYENGVRSSFEYFGVGEFASAYLNSEEYNRVGTSVKFTHTTEPKSVTMNYKDGYTNQTATMTYSYPDASKILYKGKKLNDQLTKIITQKYIAQTPYLALECWSDYRRLSLPFFNMIANEKTLTGSDMINTWTPEAYLQGQKWQYYPQRLRYPSTLSNADPENYQKALGLLGGDNTVMTPLWWSIH